MCTYVFQLWWLLSFELNVRCKVAMKLTIAVQYNVNAVSETSPFSQKRNYLYDWLFVTEVFPCLFSVIILEDN